MHIATKERILETNHTTFNIPDGSLKTILARDVKRPGDGYLTAD